MVVVPLAFFLGFGWRAREAEFIDKVRDQPHNMEIYFEKFWSEGCARADSAAEERRIPTRCLLQCPRLALVARSYRPARELALPATTLTGGLTLHAKVELTPRKAKLFGSNCRN